MVNYTELWWCEQHEVNVNNTGINVLATVVLTQTAQ